MTSSVSERAEKARGETVPEKSKKIYNSTYDKYLKWRMDQGIEHSRDEDTLLAYFHMLSEKYVPSSLWSTYSMLRRMINNKEKFDIEKYSELMAFIKRKNDGYESKKSKTLTRENIHDFIRNAPDEIYLAQKVY